MNRFPLYPIFDSINRYTGKRMQIPVWRLSTAERELIDWLTANVGKCLNSSYKFPLRGEGWCAYEGGSEDEHPDDYSWRHIQREYKISGEYGFWLQVEDDMKAVELKLSGVLDHMVKPKYWR